MGEREGREERRRRKRVSFFLREKKRKKTRSEEKKALTVEVALLVVEGVAAEAHRARRERQRVGALRPGVVVVVVAGEREGERLE